MGFRNPITTAEDPTARAAAAAAQSTANDAQSAASNAQSTANSALTAANGKNTIYVSATAPTAPAGGFTSGDQWVDTTNNVIKTWTSGAWQVVQLGSAAIVAGAITASLIAANAIGTNQLAAGTVLTGELDTGASSGARIRIYEAPDPDTGNPRGVIEWDDGIAGDVAASLVQAVNVNPHSITIPYGKTSLNGGSYGTPVGLKAAPDINLMVDQDDNANPRRTFQVTGADRIDLGLGWAFLRATAVQPASGTMASGWQTLTFGAADTDIYRGWSATVVGALGPDRYVVQAAGDYDIEGIAAVGSVAAGSYVGARIIINGAFRPGGVGDVQPIPAGSASPQTGRKRYTLAVGDVVQLQGYCNVAWATRMTAGSDGITSTLLIEKIN